MALGVIVLIVGMAVIALIALGFLIWGIRNKQFKDVEEAKYIMLEDQEPQPWPHQEGE
jgi:cbb3-type cytochrome oxidase maturation protein